MKTTHSDNIVVIVGNAGRKQHRQMHSSYTAKRRTVKIESSVTTAEHGPIPSERTKHTCNIANTAAVLSVYLVQGRVGSCHADTGN